MTEYRIRWVPSWISWLIKHKAFVVWLPLTDHPWMCLPRRRRNNPQWVERTKAHEIVHVDQWVELGRVGFLRTYFIEDGGKLSLEAPAFAASCVWWYAQGYSQLMRDGVLTPVLQHYALELHYRYGFNLSIAACRAAIEEHLHA